MDCNSARRLLEFARPGATELEAAEIAALERHLADCPGCGRAARAERVCDDRIAAAIQDVSLPPGARERLLFRASAMRMTWWRTQALRLSLAACIAGVGWWSYPAPRFDAEEVCLALDAQVNNKSGAEKWLMVQNSRFKFPPRFHDRDLRTYELRNYYGVTAPVLTFAKQSSLARVVVVTPGQFRNLPSLPDGRAAENSMATLLIVRDADRPGVVYIIEVLNGPVEPFYADDDPTAAMSIPKGSQPLAGG